MSMPSTSAEFDSSGYVVLKSIIGSGSASSLCAYSRKLAATGGAQRRTKDAPGSSAAYGDPFTEDLLERLLPTIEQASGRRLFPTYSYLRVYHHGSELKQHKDRPACEISVSLCLGYQAESVWPLFVEGPNGVFAAALQPGDGLLYKGVECAHWREPFPGEWSSHVFLHYVDQNGPHAEWKLDKRADLGRLVISPTETVSQNSPVQSP
jgi:hypothetical protein